tara:strand:+ start:7924 stop:11556 length:3633 start_codon:yes stop_codon:yes gene_type:complete
MSIFKESFRNFVRKQLRIRQEIIKFGNEGDGRMGGRKVDLGNLGGGSISIPEGAFYTNTVGRACVLRMSSGVDLRPTADFLEGGKFEKIEDLTGPGLAKRYILEGGTLINIPGESDGKVTMTSGARRGFPGTAGKLKSGKQRSFGFPYGDPAIRGNASSDGYGIVPMPGIKSADIQTKSAYGSLRTAKIEFHCHNQRQLEVLELLYMRPGYPILLEWGWTTYINNEGKRSSEFPTVYEFFEPAVTQAIINKKIIDNKEKTGGNYDGLLGFCKNFSYKARPDGGFDCKTEIVAAGEIIESIKPAKVAKEIKRPGEGKQKGTDIIEVILMKVNTIGLIAKGNKFVQNHFLYPKSFKNHYQELVNKHTEDIRVPLGLSTDSEVFPLIIPKHRKFECAGAWNFDDDFEATYIRWDALCQLFNFHFIPLCPKEGKDGVREPLFILTTDIAIGEGNEKKVVPLEYATVPNPLKGTKAKFDFVTNVLDISLDPTVCILPHQMRQVAGSVNIGKGFAVSFLSPLLLAACIWGDHDFMYDYELTPEVEERQIGMIYLNVEKLLHTHRQMMYNDDNSYNEDYNLYDFIQKIWDDVNDACAGMHDFKLSIDHERPNLVRVIDNVFAGGTTLNAQSDIVTLNIQSNDSVVRDFSYHTSIPSAMSATIAASAQNPDNPDDLDQMTFAAINKNITNRLAQPVQPKPKEAMPIEEQNGLAEQYDDEVTLFQEGIAELEEFQKELLTNNDYQEITVKTGERDESETIDEKKNVLRGVMAAGESILRKHPKTEGVYGPYKGQIRAKAVAMARSAIIPLKFNAELDGISGIVIGNVFKIPDSRLPRGYKDCGVAFVTTGERQKITAGQDWTTKITGQMMILDDPSVRQDISDLFDYNDFNEELGVNYLEEEEYDWGAYQGTVTTKQKEIPGCIEELKKGNAVYLKELDDRIHLRSSPKVSNHEMVSRDDNIMGTFDRNCGGLYLGTVVDVVNQSTLNGFKTDNDKDSPSFGMLVDDQGNPPDVTRNDSVPWYYIEFDYKSKALREFFRLGKGPNASGEYGYYADDWEDWYTDVANLRSAEWHDERWESGNYNAGTGGGNNKTDDIKGAARGYLRVDVISPNPMPPAPGNASTTTNVEDFAPHALEFYTDDLGWNDYNALMKKTIKFKGADLKKGYVYGTDDKTDGLVDLLYDYKLNHYVDEDYEILKKNYEKHKDNPKNAKCQPPKED